MTFLNENPKLIFDNIKELLVLGVKDRSHPFHTPIFTSNNIENIPNSRIVVLRNFDDINLIINFHTDFRSPKIKEIQYNNNTCFVFYDPKLKNILPYYDRFPLVLPLERYNDGFLGINLHYLPIPLRIRLLDRLVDFSNNTKFDESTVLNVSYNALKRVRLIKPTIKRYLAGKVKSRFRRIDADEFTVATLLPVQRFSKASEREVWKDSRGMI